MGSAAAAAEPKDAKERDMGIFPYQEKAMRVITGSARGRRLQTLEGQEVRPTPERIKEAVFSIIQFEIEGRRFLDLFAGSGQMGIEALSRGAREAVLWIPGRIRFRSSGKTWKKPDWASRVE